MYVVGSAFGTVDAVPMTAALDIATSTVYLAAARMGWIANLLSRAVMSGFILGFSIGIIFDQSAVTGRLTRHSGNLIRHDLRRLEIRCHGECEMHRQRYLPNVPVGRMKPRADQVVPPLVGRERQLQNCSS